MKLHHLLAMLALVAWACSPAKQAAQSSATLAVKSQDSTEYEIIIIDPNFDQWYLKNYNLAVDRSNDYYHAKNLFAVSNWNYYYHTGQYPKVVENYLDYRPDIDYGMEVNRKLYWYFKYVTETYGIKLFW